MSYIVVIPLQGITIKKDGNSDCKFIHRYSVTKEDKFFTSGCRNEARLVGGEDIIVRKVSCTPKTFNA